MKNLTSDQLKEESYENSLKHVREQVLLLEQRIKSLETAARALRTAQKNYMSNRGNQEAGKAVAVTAKELDRVLGDT